MFGDYIRNKRNELYANDKSYSLRQVARRIGVEPAYLSKVERGEVSPPSESTITRLAYELGEDADVLLALAGKVSSELQNIIRERPLILAEFIRKLEYCSDEVISRLMTEIKDTEK